MMPALFHTLRRESWTVVDGGSTFLEKQNRHMVLKQNGGGFHRILWGPRVLQFETHSPIKNIGHCKASRLVTYTQVTCGRSVLPSRHRQSTGKRTDCLGHRDDKRRMTGLKQYRTSVMFVTLLQISTQHGYGPRSSSPPSPLLRLLLP